MLHTRFCSSHSHAQLRANFVSFAHPWASMCSPSFSPSLFPSHIHTPTGILVASSHSITHAPLDPLGACKSPAAKPILHQHFHMHHPKCPGAGGAATRTEQQAAPQMLLCSRHQTAAPSLEHLPMPLNLTLVSWMWMLVRKHRETRNTGGPPYSFLKIPGSSRAAWCSWVTRDHPFSP